MEYKRDGNIIALRLDPKDEIMESLLLVAKKENIEAASVSGIGATNDFTVGVFDINNKEYINYHLNGDYEIASLNGDLTIKDNNPHAHMHIVCSTTGPSCVAGHLIEAKISLTCEIIINVINFKINRKFNDKIGIYTWEF